MFSATVATTVKYCALYGYGKTSPMTDFDRDTIEFHCYNQSGLSVYFCLLLPLKLVAILFGWFGSVMINNYTDLMGHLPVATLSV